MPMHNMHVCNAQPTAPVPWVLRVRFLVLVLLLMLLVVMARLQMLAGALEQPLMTNELGHYYTIVY